jgi:putative transcriptional regulator
MIENRLSVLLGERRMSVAELQRATGLHYGSLLDMYNGRTQRFDGHVLARLCDFFGVELGELLVYAPKRAGERSGGEA